MKYIKASFYTIIIITLIIQQIQIYFLMDRMQYCPMWTRSLSEQLDREVDRCNDRSKVIWSTISDIDHRLWGIINANKLIEKEEEIKGSLGEPIE